MVDYPVESAAPESGTGMKMAEAKSVQKALREHLSVLISSLNECFYSPAFSIIEPCLLYPILILWLYKVPNEGLDGFLLYESELVPATRAPEKHSRSKASSSIDLLAENNVAHDKLLLPISSF